MDTVQLTPTGLIVTGIPWLEFIKIADNPTLPSLSFPDLIDLGKLQISGNAVLTSVDMHSLVSVVGTMDFSGFGSSGNPLLTTISLPALQFIGLTLDLRNSSQLTTFSLPSLVTMCTGNNRSEFRAENCSLLANVSLPNWLPTNKKRIWLNGCALTEASVDHVLARCVASSSYVSGVVTLEGGTASPPSATGLLDVATLQARGVVVTHN